MTRNDKQEQFSSALGKFPHPREPRLQGDPRARPGSDGRQYFPAVPEQDADVLEVLIGKVGKDRDVDAVLRKRAGLEPPRACKAGYLGFQHHFKLRLASDGRPLPTAPVDEGHSQSY
jgi:hypothetical protein